VSRGAATALAGACLVACLLASSRATAGTGPGPFRPSANVVSRTSFAGITPKLSFAAVMRRWGTNPLVSPRRLGNLDHGSARWGYSPYGGTAAFAYFAGFQPGNQPFRYAIDLAVARDWGANVRTSFGDRAGTSVQRFRSHWPNAVRVASEPGYTWFVAQPAFRGWRLLFVFNGGSLRSLELVRASYVAQCVRRHCDRYRYS